jgi:hypothetical protein
MPVPKPRYLIYTILTVGKRSYVMRTSLPAAEAVDNWFRLYKTAIFESNKEVRSRRIAEAERAIAQRGARTFS